MHVAIIMNGNGRWAKRLGLPPTAACIEGAAALRTTVEAALRAGIKTLTVHAICHVDSERSGHELDADLRVLGNYLRTEARHSTGQAVRISVTGNCKRLGAATSKVHDETSIEMRSRLHLRIVIDYPEHDRVVQSTRTEVLRAHAAEDFERRVKELDRTALPAGAVDLLIRTGGGICRSDFMLWEAAYARLHYADCLWPDFNALHFQRALGREMLDELARRPNPQPDVSAS
ncbi:MAG TPA: polyprenyl diphosphate synthase [Steroidobacteraceae bacterium]